MKSLKKYSVTFVVQFILFTGVLCLFDWGSLDSHRFYSNLVQGVLFGVFMTAYNYWDDNRKKKKDGVE